jgi:hypothetical protein
MGNGTGGAAEAAALLQPGLHGAFVADGFATPPQAAVGSAGRPAARGQGCVRGRGPADGRRQPHLVPPAGGRAVIRASSPDSAGCRRGLGGQDRHRRAGLQPVRPQHPLRHPGQPNGPRAHSRRVVVRFGRCRRRGTCRYRPGHRLWRVLPPPGQLLRRVGHPSDAGPHRRAGLFLPGSQLRRGGLVCGRRHHLSPGVRGPDGREGADCRRCGVHHPRGRAGGGGHARAPSLPRPRRSHPLAARPVFPAGRVPAPVALGAGAPGAAGR